MSTTLKLPVALIIIIAVGIAGIGGGYYYGLSVGGAEATKLIETERTQWQSELDKKIEEAKTLWVGVTGLGISLDPAYCWASDLQQFLLTGVYDTLIRTRGYDVGTFYPCLAESWEISDDGLSYTFHLYKGVKFASGNEVTADAVAYTYWRIMKLNLGPAWLFTQCIDVNNTDSIKVLDRYTVQINLAERFPPFMTILACMNGGVMDPAEVEKHGGQLSEESVEYFSEHSALAGSGPYILDHWTREVEAVLIRNPNYWGGSDGVVPWFDKIVFQEIKEPADQKMMLERGDLDIAYGTTPDMWVEWQQNKKVDLNPLDPARYYYMGMNCKDLDSPFRDLKVRQAVKCAIDREVFLELDLGFGHLQGGPVVYGYPGDDPTLLEGPYSSVGNIAKAKQLMSESNYPNGFKTELLVSEGTIREQMAPLVKEQLAQIGIDVDIRVYASATALMMFRRAEYKGLAVFSWGIDYPDPQNLADIHMTVGGAVNLRVEYTPDIHPSLLETDELCKQAMETEDPVLRGELYKEAQWIDHEYGPWVYFYGVTYMRPRRHVIHGGFPMNPLYGWELKEMWKEIEW